MAIDEVQRVPELLNEVHRLIEEQHLTLNIPAFTRFLEVAALSSGKMLNFSEIASDTAVPVSTVREYYHVLEDTFIGFMVPGWTKSIKRKAIAKAKFYLFDIGVKHTLAQITELIPKSDLFGQALEHFIAMELRAWLDYSRINKTLSYWCSTHGVEVDFIVGDDIAIEVKATNQIHDKHLKNLHSLIEENICKKYIIVSFDKINRKKGQIDILHWETFLELLWNDFK